MREIREDSTPIIVRSDSPLRSVTITFLIRYFTVGGLERVVSTLANEYTQAGLLVRIVVLEPGKRNALLTELDPRVDVQMVHERGPGRVRRLRELTRDTIVHINFGDGRIHPWVRTCLFNRNVVVTYHSDYAHKRHKMTNRADRIFAGRVQEIVAVSRASETKRRMSRLLPASLPTTVSASRVSARSVRSLSARISSTLSVSRIAGIERSMICCSSGPRAAKPAMLTAAHTTCSVRIQR